MLKMTKQSGQALVAATVGLVTLIGATGLAIDVGYLRYQKRLQQSAADSAAIAGAGDISYVTDGANIQTTARNDASLNGFTEGTHVRITVNHPSSVAPYNVNPSSVEVLLAVDQPTFFMKIFGYTQATITARAVALASGKFCAYSLSRVVAAIGMPGCGVDNQALVARGSVPAADPLAYLKAPNIRRRGGCLDGNVVGSTGPTPPVFATLNPGNYCGGISVTGKANVTLNPGTYLITGGGVTFNNAGNINGTGVTFYLSAGGGGVSINPTHGGALTADLVAPTTGAFAGILFYQDRGNASNATIDGNGGSKLQGALYFPDAALNLDDVGANAAYTIAVAESLNLIATTFNDNYTSLPNGSPVKTAVLVE